MASWRVLIVDDESDIRDVVSEFLESVGHHVDSVASGREAILRIGTSPVPYDVALVDWTMPGISGRDVLAEIARTSPTTRLVIATGKVDPLQLPGGAVAEIPLLAKPFTFRELLSVLNYAISTERSTRSNEGN